MGAAVSSSIVVNTVNSLTSIVNSTVSKTTQSVQTQCTGFNEFRGIVGSVPVSITNGNIQLALCNPQPSISSFIVSQTSQNSCSIQGGITNEVSQTINNELSNEIKDWLSSEAKANNGFLGFGISIAESEGINQTDLSNKIANTLTNNLVQNCNAAVLSSNDGTIYFCGTAPNGIIITQNALNTNLTSCIINNVVTAIGNDQVLNDIVQRALSKANATNEGVGSLFSWLKWVILAAVIIAVIVIIAVLIYFITSGKKAKTPEESGGIVEEKKKILMKCADELKDKLEGKTIYEKSKLIKECALKNEEKKEVLEK